MASDKDLKLDLSSKKRLSKMVSDQTNQGTVMSPHKAETMIGKFAMSFVNRKRLKREVKFFDYSHEKVDSAGSAGLVNMAYVRLQLVEYSSAHMAFLGVSMGITEYEWEV